MVTARRTQTRRSVGVLALAALLVAGPSALAASADVEPDDESSQDGYEPPGEPELAFEILDPVCDGDVPYLRYAVTTTGTKVESVTITWLNPSGADVVQAGLPASGRVLWPGAVVADDGTPLDWPGWRLENGVWVEGDEFDWVRPAVDVQFEVNPTAVVQVDYPPSSPDCATDPPSVPSGPEPAPPADASGTPPTVTSMLPRTGAQLAAMIAVAGGFVVLGAMALVLRRRRD